MLVELRLVEQRYKAVLEVLEGATVTGVARRYDVARQTVHDWLRRYGDHGLAGLADRTSRPASCPHQMPPGPWCAMASSKAKNVSGAGLITVASNARGPCSCGRWTWWAASTSWTAPS